MNIHEHQAKAVLAELAWSMPQLDEEMLVKVSTERMNLVSNTISGFYLKEF